MSSAAQRNLLIRRLNLARTQLESELKDAPSEKHLYQGWTIRQLMAHIAGWDDVIIDALKSHALDQPVTTSASRGIDEYNHQTVTSRETLSLEHTKREFEATRAAVIQALRDLPDEKFNQPLIFPWGEFGTVAYLIEIFVDHEETHAGHLRSWKVNPDQVIGEH